MALCAARSKPVYAFPLSPAPIPGPRLGDQEMVSLGRGWTLKAPPRFAASSWYHTGVLFPLSTMA